VHIQDWWPTYPRIDELNHAEVLVAENGDPFRGERYLYILAVTTLHPGDTVTAIRIRGVTNARVSLGILGVTVFCDPPTP
jgi:hypothetical protein